MFAVKNSTLGQSFVMILFDNVYVVSKYLFSLRLSPLPPPPQKKSHLELRMKVNLLLKICIKSLKSKAMKPG